MTESNPEQDLADIERAFEDSKQARILTKNSFEMAKARYHMTLVARRAAGEKLTIPDMEALEAMALDDVQEVKDAYLDFICADSKYRDTKVKHEAAVRDYWDKKESRKS